MAAPTKTTRVLRNEGQGSLIRGSLTWGVPFYAARGQRVQGPVEIVGMIVSSFQFCGRAYIYELNQEFPDIRPYQAILYGNTDWDDNTHLMSLAEEWGYARILVHKDHQLLRDWNQLDGTLPLLYKGRDLERLVVATPGL